MLLNSQINTWVTILLGVLGAALLLLGGEFLRRPVANESVSIAAQSESLCTPDPSVCRLDDVIARFLPDDYGDCGHRDEGKPGAPTDLHTDSCIRSSIQSGTPFVVRKIPRKSQVIEPLLTHGEQALLLTGTRELVFLEQIPMNREAPHHPMVRLARCTTVSSDGSFGCGALDDMACWVPCRRR